MYPFWESIVEPVIRASNARRIVEIGALRGETTALMLDDLGPEAELHVIDPVPEFDPTEHEQRFGGRYVFHRDLSLNVLPTIGATDVALVDGDHNWYTVHNELRVLAETSRREHQPLPVLILHDVCWPYGRRDLYYAPEQIPEEFRQPYRKAGMRPGRKDLLKAGGMNVQLDNALEEGGPRNGVMTALDDFIAEHDRPLRRVVLPIYFGLAIVVEQDRLDTTPALAAELDRIESLTGKDELLELSEQIRLNAVVFEHNVGAHRNRQQEKVTARYLDLLKHALVGEHGLDNEVRVHYLRNCLESGIVADPTRLIDPRRFLNPLWTRFKQERRTGRTRGEAGRTTYAYASLGLNRLNHLQRVMQAVRTERVPGDLVECGTGRGGGGIFMKGFLSAYDIRDRSVWIADPFLYETEESDLNQVREGFELFDVLDDQVKFLQGEFGGVLPPDHLSQVALLRVGDHVGDDVELVLDRMYDLVVDGGFVIIDNYDDPRVQEAADRFRARRSITTPMERVDWWGMAWRRDVAAESSSPVAAPDQDATAGVPARAPLAPPMPEDPLDLTIVAVFHDMKRESARTLHTLTREYQRNIDDLRYEVLAFDNGSADEQRLDPDWVASFGPEFRLIDMGPDAPTSPTVALNEGMRLGRGANFMMMVDGAHLVTPGVLQHGMAGLRSYPPAVVAAQQWYVGPGQQPDAVRRGYDQGVEDTLFEQIDWPTDGYRVFEISHFIGERDWFDGVFESNCFLVPRSVLEQVGGFDDAFSMPGGGYTNLEVFERLAAAPDVQLVTMIGEGSFHQVHGGITTNDTDVEDRRRKTFAYGENYREFRGRLLRGPTTPMHFVGAFTSVEAKRTRSRRMTGRAFVKGRLTGPPDGIPEVPTIIPDDLKQSFIESFWNSLAWKDVRWLGRSLRSAATDVIVYQELVASLLPDWIIETGTANGARALLLASVCESMGHGQVLSIDNRPKGDLPEHPRITYLTQPTDQPDTFAQVAEMVGADSTAMVILGGRAGQVRTVREFEGLSPLVSVGSYVIVEHTMVNGRPVWPGFGPGPAEAVRQILQVHGNFAADPMMERFGLTFNPGGYLKRMS